MCSFKAFMTFYDLSRVPDSSHQAKYDTILPNVDVLSGEKLGYKNKLNNYFYFPNVIG